MLGIASEHQAAYLNLEFRIFVNIYNIDSNDVYKAYKTVFKEVILVMED